MKIKTKKATDRSLDQNAYYWGVVVATLSESLKIKPEKTHALLKRKFNNKESTTILSTADFCNYCDNIISWSGSVLGTDIPLPPSIDE